MKTNKKLIKCGSNSIIRDEQEKIRKNYSIIEILIWNLAKLTSSWAGNITCLDQNNDLFHKTLFLDLSYFCIFKLNHSNLGNYVKSYYQDPKKQARLFNQVFHRVKWGWKHQMLIWSKTGGYHLEFVKQAKWRFINWLILEVVLNE